VSTIRFGQIKLAETRSVKTASPPNVCLFRAAVGSVPGSPDDLRAPHSALQSERRTCARSIWASRSCGKIAAALGVDPRELLEE